jgi:hypothetical protein
MHSIWMARLRKVIARGRCRWPAGLRDQPALARGRADQAALDHMTR